MTPLGRLALHENLRDRGKRCLHRPCHRKTNTGISKGRHWLLIAAIRAIALEHSDDLSNIALICFSCEELANSSPVYLKLTEI